MNIKLFLFFYFISIINKTTMSDQSNIPYNDFNKEIIQVDNYKENDLEIPFKNNNEEISTQNNNTSQKSINNELTFINDISSEKQNFNDIISKDLANNTDQNKDIIENDLDNQDYKNNIPKNNIETVVNFNIEGKTLYDVIIALSELKKINILIPSFIEADKIIVNFSIGKNIPLDEVEDYLLYFINMAGLVLTLQDNVFIITKKTEDHLRRYNFPLYVNPKANDLPDNNAYVRVITFLEHTKVPTPSGQGSESIKQILFSLLPDKTNGVWVDPKTNSIMISGPSSIIANILLLIEAIDQSIEPECITELELQYTNADYVNKLIEELLQVSKDNSNPNASPISVQTEEFCLPLHHIYTVVNNSNNTILFIGKEDPILKMIAFIKKYIDIPETQGEITIHIYNLKYLEAKKIAPILQDFVNGTSTNAGDQSIKDKNTNTKYRKFDNVRIIPEEIVPVKRTNLGNQQVNTKLNVGGNHLIISASEDDYIEIKKIIESLDQFQPTIILEMIILDFEENIFRNFSSDTRLPKYFNLPMGAQIQSLMMDNSMLMLQNPGATEAISSNANITPMTTMAANLLAEYPTGGDSSGQMTSLANKAPRNGLIISLGENFPNSSIWSILQLQEDILRRSLIEHPTIVTKDNTPIKIQNIVVKRGAGELSPNNTQYGGATVVNINSYNASLAIELVPHLSFGSYIDNQQKKVNLEINIAMEDFKTDNPNDFTKLNRGIKTNANINSGDILVIGGLHKERIATTSSKVPFLGDIPLLGGLFRQKVTEIIDSNLVFCVRPIVVETEEQLRLYTELQTNNYKSELSQNCFANCHNKQTIKLK